MDEVNLSGSKHLSLNIDDDQRLSRVARALSNPLRLDIIKALGRKSMQSINELSESLNVPLSSVALAVRTLEEADLIFTESVPGIHGMLKLSTRKTDTLGITLVPHETKTESILSISMPVGGYSQAGNIKPTCGLASSRSSIGEDDNPRAFYSNTRFDAQLIWFRQGFIEYLFGVINIHEIDILWVELTFEACSEAPMYRDPWKSDIAVSINDRLLGIWTSPCDCGEHRGKLNPPWWSDLSTQHGFLKTWRVDQEGSHLDSVPISDTRLSDLQLYQNDAIKVRIEVSPDARHVGGINIFGQGFGDFEQDIVLRIGYKVKEIPSY